MDGQQIYCNGNHEVTKYTEDSFKQLEKWRSKDGRAHVDKRNSKLIEMEDKEWELNSILAKK